METLIHECLHSIQECEPHRENIVKYLTYRLTQNPKVIEPLLLAEWKEIEQQEGIESIKRRLITQGDCEDF